MKNERPNADSGVIDLLNNILKIEYSLIVHYPRLANRIKDNEIKRLAHELGIASIAHADTVANAIKKLGGEAIWSFEQLPDEDNVVKIFQLQLEKEKVALKLHQQVAALITDSQIKEQISRLAQEERSHIKSAEKIMAELEA